MQTSTISACRVSAAPPLAGSTVKVTPESVVSALVTLEPSLNLIPCLASERWNCRVISSSTPGVMRSRNSTTVTSDPSRRQTEPSSSPMMPAPTTMRCFGTSASSSAPVDDTIFFSSTATPGRGMTSEPEAIRMFLADSVSLTAPSSPSTTTEPAFSMRPVPWNAVILFFRNRKATPLVVASTTSLLRFISWAKSSLGGASTMPWTPRSWPACSNRCEDCSSALDGMQPTLRQVPPKVARFSTTATFMPSWAARIAAT